MTTGILRDIICQPEWVCSPRKEWGPNKRPNQPTNCLERHKDGRDVIRRSLPREKRGIRRDCGISGVGVG